MGTLGIFDLHSLSEDFGAGIHAAVRIVLPNANIVRKAWMESADWLLQHLARENHLNEFWDFLDHLLNLNTRLPLIIAAWEYMLQQVAPVCEARIAKLRLCDYKRRLEWVFISD